MTNRLQTGLIRLLLGSSHYVRLRNVTDAKICPKCRVPLRSYELPGIAPFDILSTGGLDIVIGCVLFVVLGVLYGTTGAVAAALATPVAVALILWKPGVGSFNSTRSVAVGTIARGAKHTSKAQSCVKSPVHKREAQSNNALVPDACGRRCRAFFSAAQRER